MIFKNYIEFAEKDAFFNQKDHLLEKLEWNNGSVTKVGEKSLKELTLLYEQ